MFKWFHKNIFEKFRSRARALRGSSGGQIAIVLIILTAIALIFYAVALNFGRANDIKVATQVASLSGASLLASQLSSYGQMLFMETLGGRLKYCDHTSVLTTIIMIIIIIIVIIILIIITILCYGTCAPGTIALASALIQALVISAVLQVVNLALQVAVVQPGLTSAWNKAVANTLSTADAALEAGIRDAFQRIVSDGRQSPDLFDMDQDGVYGYDPTGQARDYIGRPSMYYDLRIKGVTLQTNPAIEGFIDTLHDFVYKDPPLNSPIPNSPNWALYDPLPDCTTNPGHICCGVDKPNECNPCCQPVSIPDPRDPTVQYPVRPECCDSTDPMVPSCGTAATCTANTPYANYDYIYDAYADDDQSAFLSFRELIGRDDENQNFTKFAANPNSLPGAININQLPFAPAEFLLDDTTNFYAEGVQGVYTTPVTDYIRPIFSYPPPSPPPGDNRRGIFPIFYKVADWGMDLNALNPLNSPEHCYWYDENLEPACNGVALPKELQDSKGPAFSLPNNPLTLSLNRTHFVDGVNPPGWLSTSPLAVDKVRTSDDIIAADADCAQLARTTGDGFWKRGSDRFCTAGDVPNLEWPYHAQCPKHNLGTCTVPDPTTSPAGTLPIDCDCPHASTNNALFPEDVLDDMIYEFSNFLQWATAVLSMTQGQQAIGFSQWYTLGSHWLSPDDPLTPANELGQIFVWKNNIDMIVQRLNSWRQMSFKGASCAEVWCVPDPALACPGIPPEEAATFNANGNTIDGDIDDVLACLNYNVEGYNFTAGAVNPLGTNRGNDFRFQECRRTCSLNECDNLPRSLMTAADFNPAAFTPPVNPAWQADVDRMLRCLDGIPRGNTAACTLQQLTNCRLMPQGQGSGSCTQYFTRDPATFTDGPCMFDCGLRYFAPVKNPATDFNELRDCYGNRQYFTQSPFAFDFENAPQGCNDAATWPAGTSQWKTEAGNASSGAIGMLVGLGCSDISTDPNFCQDYQDITSCMNQAPNPPPPGCSNAICQNMPQYPSDPSFWTGKAVPFIAENYYHGAAVANLQLLSTSSDDITGVACNFFTDPDFVAMSQCVANCNQVDCQAMPQWRNRWAPGNQWYDQIQTALNVTLPGLGRGSAADPDYAAIQNCLNTCNSQGCGSACETACRAMPMFDSTCVGGGTLYFSQAPSTGFAPTDCGSNAATCPTGWGPGCRWYDRIVGTSPTNPIPTLGVTDNGAILMANAMCDLRDDDRNPITEANNGWLLNAERSGMEAQNQVAKFRLRRDFLHNRIQEMDRTTQIFTDAQVQFTELANQTNLLNQEYQNQTNVKKGLPDMLIYGWQDDPPPNNPTRVSTNNGYWHLVMIEGRVPDRCYGRCGPGAGGAQEKGWPRVKTETHGFLNTTRCYELKDYEGIVKFRVTRWDEQRDSNMLRFPNLTQIWNFTNPARIAGGSTIGLSTACQGTMIDWGTFAGKGAVIPASVPFPELDRRFRGAFMLSDYTKLGASEIGCWDRAVGLLRRGVVTETCARYYFHRTPSRGMGMKFIPCPGRF